MLHGRSYKISFFTRNLQHSLIHLKLHCLLLQFDSLYYLKAIVKQTQNKSGYFSTIN